jgi:hypothetical protein
VTERCRKRGPIVLDVGVQQEHRGAMNLAHPPLDPDHAQHAGRRRPSTAPSRDPGSPPTTVPSPSARITRRHLGPGSGALFTVAGAVGAHDAAVLSRCLHAQLDERAGAAPDTASAVIVVDLTEVESYGAELVELLVVAEERARTLAVGLHVLELGRSGLREQWQTRHGHKTDQARSGP